MKRSKPITLRFHPTSYEAPLRKALTKRQYTRLLSAIRREGLVIQDHFAIPDGGWDLSWRGILEGVVNEMLGTEALHTYVLFSILKQTGATWEFKLNRQGYEEPMLVKPKRRTSKA